MKAEAGKIVCERAAAETGVLQDFKSIVVYDPHGFVRSRNGVIADGHPNHFLYVFLN